jgi:hypothetical protein
MFAVILSFSMTPFAVRFNTPHFVLHFDLDGMSEMAT